MSDTPKQTGTTAYRFPWMVIPNLMAVGAVGALGLNHHHEGAMAVAVTNMAWAFSYWMKQRTLS